MKCTVCNRIPRQKKLELPCYHDTYLSTEYVCICENCLKRLPNDLYTRLIKEVQLEKIDPKFSYMIINALKNTNPQNKLNSGWCLFYSGKNGHDLRQSRICKLQYFKKTGNRRKPTLLQISNSFRDKMHIHSVYVDGKLVQDSAIEKMLNGS